MCLCIESARRKGAQACWLIFSPGLLTALSCALPDTTATLPSNSRPPFPVLSTDFHYCLVAQHRSQETRGDAGDSASCTANCSGLSGRLSHYSHSHDSSPIPYIDGRCKWEGRGFLLSKNSALLPCWTCGSGGTQLYGDFFITISVPQLFHRHSASISCVMHFLMFIAPVASSAGANAFRNYCHK